MKSKSFKIFSDKTGSLIPFYNTNHFKNFKLKDFFLFMVKKDTLEPTMHTKNVVKYLYQLKGL